jgi:hypothetical protein
MLCPFFAQLCDLFWKNVFYQKFAPYGGGAFLKVLGQRPYPNLSAGLRGDEAWPILTDWVSLINRARFWAA